MRGTLLLGYGLRLFLELLPKRLLLVKRVIVVKRQVKNVVVSHRSCFAKRHEKTPKKRVFCQRHFEIFRRYYSSGDGNSFGIYCCDIGFKIPDFLCPLLLLLVWDFCDFISNSRYTGRKIPCNSNADEVLLDQIQVKMLRVEDANDATYHNASNYDLFGYSTGRIRFLSKHFDNDALI